MKMNLFTRGRLFAGSLPTRVATVCLGLFLGGQARSHGAETVEGIVVFRGEIPKSAVADDAGVHRELLHADRVTGGLQNVVVW